MVSSRALVGIIDDTEMETFTKEPKLAKLMRDQKSTPVRYHKKMSTGFARMSVSLNLLCFGALLQDNL